MVKMPGVPPDALKQVKKGLKRLFSRKKKNQNPEGSSEHGSTGNPEAGGPATDPKAGMLTPIHCRFDGSKSALASVEKTPLLTIPDSAKPEKSTSATAAPAVTTAPTTESAPVQPHDPAVTIVEPGKPVTDNTSQSEFPAAEAEPSSVKPVEPASKTDAPAQ
ncbi:hypothetical protein N7452_001111 [Penicillium brevicompactum]|uniref:Uncharacterized protein n=1 Tax=Penicillium brevicompactum TaxID=5074 RepID=A0A9W9UP72_PENBR|nr:hypothetical protein N7452_001111 [Penicillium brevicompactum]